jgi:4a-hydroxytetrahydrobiopterin dehydratase
MTLLDKTEIDLLLGTSQWLARADNGAISREWRFEDFGHAIAFVDRVAVVAELANHHPDIHLHDWNKVTLELSTHSEGGLTRADFDLAMRIDELA